MLNPTTAIPARQSAPSIVLVVGTLFAIAAGLAVWFATESQHRVRAQKAALRMTESITAQVNAHEAFLRAAAALVSVGAPSTRESLQTFVDIAGMSQRLVGVEVVGLARRVTLSARDDFESAVRAGGNPRFRIRPQAARLEYIAAVQVESLDYRHRELIGYDLLMHPELREALNEARDSGQPTASTQLPLVPDAPEATGVQVFFIVAPVFEGRGVPDTVSLRRARLRGYVFSAIRAETVITGLLPSDAQVRVIDRRVLGTQELVYESPGGMGTSSFWAIRLNREVPVAGRIWSVGFVDDASWLEKVLAPVTTLGGLVLTLLLFRVIRFQLRARLSAERAAARLRASQDALRASEAEATAANRAKDAFLATLSHELRTPLNAILGWTNMLRTGKVDPSRRDRALEVIEKNARTQAQLIEDLFDVSRIVSGKFVVDRKLMDPEPVLQAAFEAVRPLAEQRKVALVLEMAPSAQGVMVLADPARLQQVVWNLLSNAIKFTPPDGQASLSVDRVDERLRLVVKDTGVGIEAGFLPHVFERFRQADNTTTRKFGGMGLGLAIVHHLVQVHGGTVEARSEGPGRGAEFVVCLPLAERVRADDAEAEPGRERVEGEPVVSEAAP